MPRQANAWGNMGNHNTREETLKFLRQQTVCLCCNNFDCTQLVWKEYLDFGINHVVSKTALGDKND